MSVNKAILIGHVGADPEIRSMTSGAKCATFNLATSERWRDKATGERKERTDWHRVVVFSEGLVKVAEQYVKKGSKLYVEGKISTRKWQDQAGADRYTTEIVLNGFHAQLTLLDRAERAAPDPDNYGTTRDTPPAARPSTRDDLDDEIPF